MVHSIQIAILRNKTVTSGHQIVREPKLGIDIVKKLKYASIVLVFYYTLF